MNLEIINNSSGIAYAKYYSSSTYGSNSSVETIYYNAGKAGIDYRFLEYGMSYSLSEDEDDSILSFIREQDLSGKVSSEIEFLNDTILPGGSDLCPYYPDDTYIPQTNNLNFFGSFVVGLKNIYVFHVPELVWKIELFENLPGTSGNESPVIRITLNDGLEWEYEEYVFLSSTQNSSQSTPDVNISYEAWKKLINPLRNKKKRNLQSTCARVSQLEEPIQGIYFDGASGTILGTKKEESTPILDSMKGMIRPDRFSKWRNYKKGETIQEDGKTYISLSDNNIGGISPRFSPKWAVLSNLSNLTKTVTFLCKHGVFELDNKENEDEMTINIFGEEKEKIFRLTLPPGVNININDISGLGYLIRMNSVDEIAKTGERYNEIVVSSTLALSSDTVNIPVTGDDIDIPVKIKDPDGNFISFPGAAERKVYTANFVSGAVIKDYIEIDFEPDLDIDNHEDRSSWNFNVNSGIKGVDISGKKLRITPKAMIDLGDNDIIIESSLNKIFVLVANSGDFYIQNPYREVGYGQDVEFSISPVNPNDTINKIWINKTMIDGQPDFIEVPAGGIIDQSKYIDCAELIQVTSQSIIVEGIKNNLRLDIVKEDEN